MKFIYKNLTVAAFILTIIFLISVTASSFTTYIFRAQICSFGEFASSCNFEDILLHGLVSAIALGIPLHILLTIFWSFKYTFKNELSDKKRTVLKIGATIGLLGGILVLIVGYQDFTDKGLNSIFGPVVFASAILGIFGFLIIPLAILMIIAIPALLGLKIAAFQNKPNVKT